jgi:ATP-dependent exoDNAse (exonuclease V) beta subunit
MRKILKASAGTGKTYRLSLEYVNALLSGESFAEIVVMTFTRKATAEIRERIFAHLEDLVRRGEESPVWQNLQAIRADAGGRASLPRPFLERIYRAMLENKDRLHIHTIDSFLNHLFKQAIAPYLGIYSYTIIEEEKNKETAAGVFKKMLDSPEDFALMEKFLADNPERDIEHYLELIDEILKNRWKFLLIQPRPRSPLPTAGPVPALEATLRLAQEAAAAKGCPWDEFLAKDFQGILRQYLEDLPAMGSEAKEEFILKNRNAFLSRPFWNGNKLRGKEWEGVKEELLDGYEEFHRELAACIYNREMIPYEEEIFRFANRIFELYDGIKLRTKEFTHTDISNYTYLYLTDENLGLLKDGKASAYLFELLGAEVKTLFIDEFQDTSILQWKILQPLLEGKVRVIAVGDEKQSIYGWRGGEKELFAGLDRILDGQSERLKTCYRSEREITEFVNRFCRRLAVAGWEYEDVAHLPAKTGGYVEVLLGGTALKTETDTKAFQQLSPAEQQAILAGNELIVENLPQAIAKRLKELPVDYSDTVILARTGADLTAIAAELEKEGLPYLLESRESLVDHPAVKPLSFLLTYLDSGDYLALLKFLRSDLVGIGRRELKQLLTAKAVVEEFLADGVSPGEAREQLEAWRETAGAGINPNSLNLERLLPVLTEIKNLQGLAWDQLTTALIERFGLIPLYRENSGALKNIYQFFKVMRSFPCLQEFLDYLAENRESEELKQVGVKEEKAVKLMTIHKAKGLSFGTVFFYWKPGARSGRDGGQMEFFVTFDRDFSVVEDYLLTHSRYRPLFALLGLPYAAEEKRRQLMEEINNVYVALTRPERNLFLYIEGPRRLAPGAPGANWGDSESYGFYEPALLAGAGVNSLRDLITGKKLGEFQPGGQREKTASREEAMTHPELQPYFAPAAVSLAEVERINRNKEFGTDLDRQKKKSDGLAAHLYLEQIKKNTAAEREYGRRLALARFGNILGPERVAAVTARVEELLAARPELFASTPHRRVFTEYEIREGGKVYRIDRMIVDDERKEILILDFKTGETKEESQLDEYRRVVQAKTGGKYQVKTEFIGL